MKKFKRDCLASGLIKRGEDPGKGLQGLVRRFLEQETINIGSIRRAEINVAAASAGIGSNYFAGMLLDHALRDYREGRIRLVSPCDETQPAPPAEPEAPAELLSPKTARRMAELERVLELAPGHGIAEALLSDVVEQLMNGDDGLILGGWDFDDPEKARADIHTLADRWSSEDVLEQHQHAK